LQDHNIIVEVIPPSRSMSESYINKITDRIVNVINEMNGVSAVNIPEIVEENHLGLPYYKNFDNRKFGLLIREKCKKDLIINTVVVYKPKDEFGRWIDESMSYGINNFVFVGAKIKSIKYPGLGVMEANSIAKAKKANIGNILIPERENESDRLLNKTISGCSFFTTQILFEPKKICDVLRDYSAKCRSSGLNPAKIFLSFAPVSGIDGITFIKWLGAEIQETTEKRLKEAKDIEKESISLVSEAMHEIFDYVEKNNINVPLGLNFEYLTLHNLELSKTLCTSTERVFEHARKSLACFEPK